MWNYLLGKLLHTVPVSAGPISCFAVCPLSDHVAVAVHDQPSVTLYQVAGEQLVDCKRTLELSAPVVDLSFDPFGNLWVLLAKQDACVRVVDSRSVEGGEVNDVVFSQDVTESLQDWDFFQHCSSTRLDLELLKKEPHDAGQRYYSRKEQRLQAAKQTDKPE